YRGARRALEKAMKHQQLAVGKARFEGSRYPALLAQHTRNLVETLLALHDHAAAAKQAETLPRLNAGKAHATYDAACFLAHCMRLADKDPKLPEAKRKELTQAYGDRALALLRQAVRKGFKDLEHLKKDTDLDPLRGRNDFRKLLIEVENATIPEDRKP